jgi:prephenate dehydrogenase
VTRPDSATLRRCVVVGGGAVGGMLVDCLLRSGTEVCVVDRADTRSHFGGECTSFVNGDITSIGSALGAEIERADLVVLAVPEHAALACVKGVVGAMRPGALLVDTLSVKGRIVDTIRTQGFGIEAVSLNPMFAPALGIEGRPVAAIVVHDGPRARELLRLIGSWGGRVVALSAHEHDRLAGAAQALTHAAVLAFGLALTDLDVDITELSAIAPPPHSTLLALLARIASGTPQVYWDVQSTNPQARVARKALADSIHQLAELIETGNDDDFTAVFDRLRDFLGQDLARYRDICARIFEATK